MHKWWQVKTLSPLYAANLTWNNHLKWKAQAAFMAPESPTLVKNRIAGSATPMPLPGAAPRPSKHCRTQRWLEHAGLFIQKWSQSSNQMAQKATSIHSMYPAQFSPAALQIVHSSTARPITSTKPGTSAFHLSKPKTNPETCSSVKQVQRKKLWDTEVLPTRCHFVLQHEGFTTEVMEELRIPPANPHLALYTLAVMLYPTPLQEAAG